ncbi:Rho GDP-dissociation inhibitor [Handroanthus impetiginosus]|uniref:Rho GDP-dissociation inhibitor n=1 Tax=Handroanthus impetiginosus TaxID=429701 RepID=A0A2G9HSP4_9LAMI|nr:Rho GDP-dissociation inhibitor [Handroanthus impetiginosus]
MGSDGKEKDTDDWDNETNRISSATLQDPDIASDSEGRISRQPSQASCYATEDDEDLNIQLGPKLTIREHLEKDKDDESLRRWKEQLLGGVDASAVEENQEPDVKIMSLTILSPGRPDLVLPVPEDGNPKGLWFTLKEGSHYRLRFSIKVSNDIVCGLKYINTVWKTGIKVDSSKQMLGTFSPQVEPYTHEMAEETTPSGIFARGSYSARTKFVDDDNKCYLEINYTFDIQKDWPSSD